MGTDLENFGGKWNSEILIRRITIYILNRVLFPIPMSITQALPAILFEPKAVMRREMLLAGQKASDLHLAWSRIDTVPLCNYM
jgi:hypothetical protein